MIVEIYPGVSGSAALFNLTVISPTTGTSLRFGTALNPFHASVSIIVDTLTISVGDNLTNTGPTPDSEFVSPVHGNFAILLWCEIEVLDIQYQVVGGNASIVQINLSSNITTWPLSGAISLQVSTISDPLWLAAEIDAVSGNSTTFSNLFENDYDLRRE